MDQRQRYAELSLYERLKLRLPLSPAAALAVGFVVTGVIVIAFMQLPERGISPLARDCVLQYQRAQTAADSAMIDLREPYRMNNKVGGPTCGEMRRRGDLSES